MFNFFFLEDIMCNLNARDLLSCTLFGRLKINNQMIYTLVCNIPSKDGINQT